MGRDDRSTFGRLNKVKHVETRYLRACAKHTVSVPGDKPGVKPIEVYLAPNEVGKGLLPDGTEQQRVFIPPQTFGYFPKKYVIPIRRRRLASWPTDRRRCDSPVMLRLLEEIRAANRR